ncbi:MAG: hypothetical protein QOE96_1372 [Blastocatellia bacterium]|jgi:cytoskeletal protein RodZ|nr:hypothetical protein [Blastocatellia bacterium]
MNRNGNSRRGTGADVLEDIHQDVQSEVAFYDPSNPVLAPAKEIATGKRKNWKRKLIGWSFVVLLLVISGLVLYALLRNKKVASLHLGNHQTGTLREVEARSLTEYLARTILETPGQREHRQSVKSADSEHHSRLVSDFDKASDYHEAARQLATEAKNRDRSLLTRRRLS